MLNSVPLERPAGCPFDPPAELAESRATDGPLVRMPYPHGRTGWLATGHAVIRAVLADPRFSARYELLTFPIPGYPDSIPPATPGDLSGVDGADHARLRRLLTGRFTVRRMRLLTSRVEEITAEHLDAMEKHGPSVDLVSAFSHPVPSMVICELLGVPYEDRAAFNDDAKKITGSGVTPEERMIAWNSLQEYVKSLALAKRSAPTDDVLSELAASDLADEEVAGLGAFLLGAGLDTTANTIALGTFALLGQPAQVPLLLADPDRAVEEFLRYTTVAHTGMRSALEDVELAGQLIRAGETVTLSLQAGNRDPEKFADPDVLDLGRDATGHLSFSHGVHQCLGQQLARVEMRVAMPALFTRFPSLRLAVPASDVPLRGADGIYGVHELPVTWDAA